jgi:ribosomal protein S18 acetylase RimI-like enzyme
MIRYAKPQDVPAILELIHELARYENEPEAVLTSDSLLRETLFGVQPQVFALVAEDNVAQDAAVVVATAIWFVNYSTWTGRHGIYLEDLIVTSAHRGGGHGVALMSELARICVQRDYARLDWTVLDWNSPALGFYQRLGAKPLSDWTAHRVSGAALADLAQLSAHGRQ